MPVYKDKERGTWYVVMRYTALDGSRKMTTKRGFRTQRDAKNYEHVFFNKKSNNLSMTFSEFYEIYIDTMSKRLRQSTMLSKRTLFEKKIIPYFKNKRMDEITPNDILQWQNILLTLEKDENTSYSTCYLKTIHNQISALFNFAVRFYGLPSNPARIAGNMGKEKRKEMNFWTKEEYETFAKAAMKKDGIYQAFEMLYWCGIRLGELLALTPADFDYEKSTVRISKSYQRINKEDVITDPKTEKGKRVIKMPHFLSEEMKDYQSRLYDIQPNDRMFPYSKSGLHHEMDRCCKESGVKRIRLHDLRHSHVSLLIEMGFSAVDIAERVGHESVKITYRYAHMFPTKDVDIANRLDSTRGGM